MKNWEATRSGRLSMKSRCFEEVVATWLAALNLNQTRFRAVTPQENSVRDYAGFGFSSVGVRMTSSSRRLKLGWRLRRMNREINPTITAHQSVENQTRIIAAVAEPGATPPILTSCC